MDYVIGQCQNCNEFCVQQNADNFQEEPHSDDGHTNFTRKSLKKKIDKVFKIPTQLVEEAKNKFAILVEDLMGEIKQVQRQFQTMAEQVKHQSAFKGKKYESEKLGQILQKLEAGQEKKLTCHQIHLFVNNLDTKKDEQQKKQKINEALQRLMEEQKQCLFKKIKKNLNIKEAPFQAQLSSIVNEEEPSEFTLSSQLEKGNQTSDLQINFTSSEHKSFEKQEEVKQCIQKLSMFDEKKEICMKKNKTSTLTKDSSSKESMEKSQCLSVSSESNEEKSQSRLVQEQSKLVEEQSKLVQEQSSDKSEKQEKKQKKDQKDETFKKQEKKEEESETESMKQKQQQFKDENSDQDSEKNENQLKVIDLQPTKLIGKSFSLKLKIIKFIMFRYVQKIPKKHKRSKQNVKNEDKLVPKVKFIGADQTGMVLCFINYDKQIKEGSVVLLKKCKIERFLEKSYEIVSDKSAVILEKKLLKINKERSISYFKNTEELRYDLQKFDKTYPTIEGIFSLNYGEADFKDHLSFIVMVNMVFEQELYYQVMVSDWTGETEALIAKSQIKDLFQGQILFLNNVKVKKEKLGKNDQFYINTMETGQVWPVNDFVFSTSLKSGKQM